jgi:hypothetical protein
MRASPNFSGIHVLCAEDKTRNGKAFERVSGKFAIRQIFDFLCFYDNPGQETKNAALFQAQHLVIINLQVET